MKIKTYEKMIANNTPKGFPQLVCGWPDEEHDITWGRYIEHLQGLLDDLDKGDLDKGDPFPQLVCGWPDEEHDITWGRYIEHLQGLLDDLDEGDPLPTFETFKHWVVRQRDENEDRDNLGFSHIECDLCGALPGNRHAVTALPENPADNHDYHALSVCDDCMYFVANGDLPDYVED